MPIQTLEDLLRMMPTDVGPATPAMVQLPQPPMRMPRLDVPTDPREGQLQQQVAQMDQPRKIGGMESLARIGLGFGGVNPFQLQQQEDARRQQQRQNLVQQLQAIQAQRQQVQQQNEKQWEREDTQDYRNAQLAQSQNQLDSEDKYRNSQLDLERQRLAQSQLKPTDPNIGKTIETEAGLMLWNPQNQRYDIPQGKKPAQTDELVDIPAIPQLGFAGMKGVPKSVAAGIVSQLGQTQRDNPPHIDPLSPKGIEAQKQVDANKEAAKTANAGGQVSPYSKERAKRALDDIEDVRKLVGFTTTGMGASALAALGGTDARQLQGKINTLKANIAFNELAQMREASKTGGALGQVSDREGRLLESALGNLDQGLKDKALIEELDKIKGSITRWQQEMDKKGAPATPADPAPPKQGEVQNGFVYLGGDPSKPTSWRKASGQGQRGR